jgi:hypothetical protein
MVAFMTLRDFFPNAAEIDAVLRRQTEWAWTTFARLR